MDRRTVQLRVAGQVYRVVSSADEAELVRLASLVEEKLASLLGPNRPAPPQALLLAAMALAHDAEDARRSALAAEERTRERVAQLLERIDGVLAEVTPVPPSVGLGSPPP